MARPKKWTMNDLAEIFILSDKAFHKKYGIKIEALAKLRSRYGIKRKRKALRVFSESLPMDSQTIQK